jgi:hypothetical protein
MALRGLDYSRFGRGGFCWGRVMALRQSDKMSLTTLAPTGCEQSLEIMKPSALSTAVQTLVYFFACSSSFAHDDLEGKEKEFRY